MPHAASAAQLSGNAIPNGCPGLQRCHGGLAGHAGSRSSYATTRREAVSRPLPGGSSSRAGRSTSNPASTGSAAGRQRSPAPARCITVNTGGTTFGGGCSLQHRPASSVIGAASLNGSTANMHLLPLAAASRLLGRPGTACSSTRTATTTSAVTTSPSTGTTPSVWTSGHDLPARGRREGHATAATSSWTRSSQTR
jgi:hypothetical protein